MSCVSVKNIKIGEGIPKICVPIVGTSTEEVLEQAREIASSPADLAEWRCDWYPQADLKEKVDEVLHQLRDILKEKPILFTFRTEAEGGVCESSIESYLQLNRAAVDSGCVDLIDVELCLGESVVASMIAYARNKGVKVIVSNHDFHRTPPKEELLCRIQKMQAFGADIAKIAVMPKSREDVQTLLAATKEAARRKDRGPIITMSMSELGQVSRIEGEIYGSSVTFGSLKESSAPGQIPVAKLRKLLCEVHEKKA